jgi:hypothetical protein
MSKEEFSNLLKEIEDHYGYSVSVYDRFKEEFKESWKNKIELLLDQINEEVYISDNNGMFGYVISSIKNDFLDNGEYNGGYNGYLKNKPFKFEFENKKTCGHCDTKMSCCISSKKEWYIIIMFVIQAPRYNFIIPETKKATDSDKKNCVIQ